jgi:hypothetical protein
VIGTALRRVKRRLAPLVFSERPFAVVCRVLGPSLSGRLCARFIVPAAGAAPACLCIDRDVFGKDIVQLRARTPRAWPSVTQHLVYLFEQAWVPHHFFQQTAFQKELAKVPPKAIERAERFAVSLLREARRRHAVGAVLSGSVDYAPDEFLRRAAQREGMPFLALCKEHAVTDYGHRSFAASLQGFTFEGDGVAVFGPRSRDILADEDVFPPEQVWITGMPRLDEWVDLALPEHRDVAVLFSFAIDWQHGSATFPEVLAAFAEAARRAQDSGPRFVVKCRDPYEEVTVRAMVAASGAPLEVTSATPVPELLRRAFAAVGFCTLALTEALLSPAAVMSVRFGACGNDIDAQFDDRDEGLQRVVCFPRSAEELTQGVLDAAAAEVPADALAARRAIVHELFCEPRPTYSALVDEFVADAIAQSLSGSRARAPA